MPLVCIAGENVEVSAVVDGYARGPNGTCAFCNGDPCDEGLLGANGQPLNRLNSPIRKFYRRNKGADTCPCCEGRPT